MAQEENSFWSSVGQSAQTYGGKAADSVLAYLGGVIPQVVQKYTDKATGNLNQVQLQQGQTGSTPGVPINTQNQGFLNNALQASGFSQNAISILPWVLGGGVVVLLAVKLMDRGGRRR